MSPSKKAQTEATTHTLLSIARDLFTERGYAGVNLEDLAALASVTRGAVYHHFGSKQGLFLAVLELVQGEVAQAVEAAADAEPTPWDQFVAGCHAFITAACAPNVRRIMLIDGPAVLGWQSWREIDAANSGKLLEDILTELATSGLIRPTQIAATAALLSGAMNEAALWLARPATTPSDTESAHAVLDLLLASIRSG